MVYFNDKVDKNPSSYKDEFSHFGFARLCFTKWIEICDTHFQKCESSINLTARLFTKLDWFHTRGEFDISTIEDMCSTNTLVIPKYVINLVNVL